MLRALFCPSSVQGKELQRYVDVGAYELAIYNGIESLEITDQNAWSSVECGTTIFMNIAMVRSNYKDWRQCPVCLAKNYPWDNSGKLALDWYVTMLLINDVSTYLLIAGIVTGNCKVKIRSILLALTAQRRFLYTKEILNLFVTSAFTDV